jgi:site-specific DNA recombinase
VTEKAESPPEGRAHQQRSTSSQTSRVAPESDTRPVFGYVRVSTDKQETERQQGTIPVCHAALPDGLSENELELFYDHGISAWSGKTRPDFERMFEHIRNGEASALIVDTSSRLTREGIEEALGLLFTLKRASCRLFTTTGREYTPDLPGVISLVVDAQRDTDYSADLSHNISSGKAEKASKGLWHHGDVGPGYRGDKETGCLEATADLPKITEIFRRFVAGDTYKALCEYATEHISEEALVRRKNHRRDVDRRRLRNWLRNPLYAGFVPHNGERFPGKHTPAIDLVTFEKAQARLDKNAAKNASREPTRWPFSGIVKCGYCGHSLGLHSSTQRHGYTYEYVRCANEPCRKKHPLLHAPPVEANLILTLASVALTVTDLLVTDPSFAVPSSTGPTLDELLEARDADRAEVRRLGDLIADRALDRDAPQYQRALAQRDKTEKAVERANGTAQDHRDELAGLAASVLSLANLATDDTALLEFETGEPDERADWPMEETVTVIDKNGNAQTSVTMHNGTGPTLFQVLDGWRLADFDQRRAVLTQALEEAHVGPETTKLHFRADLPTPLVTETMIWPYGRDDTTRALEAEGYGWHGSTYERVGDSAPRQ